MPNTLNKYIGDGIYLWIDGTKYIDCASGTFNLSLGYSATDVIERLKEQLSRCAHLSSEFTDEIRKEVFEKLREFLPQYIESYWFRDITGSTANECAIKIAQKATGKHEVISLFLSHHGQSFLTTEVSGNAFRMKEFYGNFHSIKMPAPDCRHCFYEKNPLECEMLCARKLEDFICYASEGRVAAFIMEPVLGNGGNIVPDRRFYRLIRDICTKYGILIIADEVQTGFGRTGEFFASCGYAADLKPDIITFAKGAGGIGIPVAGVLMRKELDVLESWEHSSTSGANPLALTAMEATIEYIKEHKVLQNVKDRSVELRDGLFALKDSFPPIKNVSGIGLMYGIELEDSSSVNRFQKCAKAHGLILRPSRYGFGTTVKVRPPLIATKEEICAINSRLWETAAELWSA